MIRHEKICSLHFTIQRVAEKMNMILNERVRSMLPSGKLSKSFLGEALSMACYLVNRFLSYALEGDILK